MTELHVSILDRAHIRSRHSDAEALAATVNRARLAERLGYRRFLVAEHHGVPGIAGSAPTILAAAVASATNLIRIGTAGIMLPAHQPLVVAEQLLTLAALFPQRIDAGVGRSLGFTSAVRAALRQQPDAADHYARDLAELLSYLKGTGPVTARPQISGIPGVYVLSGGGSLSMAAELGLGVIVGGPSLFDRSTPHHAGLTAYRGEFRAGASTSVPHAIIAANIAVADTTEEARALLLPEAWALARSRTTGTFEPLPSIGEIDLDSLTATQRRRVEANLAGGIFGTGREVEQQLRELMGFTRADEIVATCGMSDVEGQTRSDELLADVAARW
ncbi:MsnO8 family LLM class oxidoreductase [Corynebacterium pacaense]|uniref:MsnO8 family LLM class oxidoreductase n=1 Tax=Corynebacterium pacaense TaxID=1816684 RepID=UPI001FE9F0E4|nr:MsnO8 family LLM class oxidoreductase [Corynebacterium pacaense]